MPQLASFVRVTLLAATALALASACGGQSFTDGGDGGDAGSGGTTSKAGTTNHAGTTSTMAGRSNGGGGTGGSGGMGFAGTGVGGAPLSEECGGPPDSGVCDAYAPSWYHDPSSGICRPFVYGGCGGNKNRYPTLEACNQACPGGSPNYDACNVPSDCMVTGTGCCGVCDSASITAHDLIAYNRQYAGFLQCALALTIAPPGGSDAGVAAPIACAPCLPPMGQGTLMYFVPDCVAGQCVVQDLRTSPLTACKTSNECKLRHGTGCCEGCSADQLVSVRDDGSLEKLVCGGGLVGCPACAPPPTDAQPYCGPTGHCEVVHPL